MTRSEGSRMALGRPSLAPRAGPNRLLNGGSSKGAPDRASSGLGIKILPKPHEERGLRESGATQQVYVDVWSRRAHLRGMKNDMSSEWQAVAGTDGLAVGDTLRTPSGWQGTVLGFTAKGWARVRWEMDGWVRVKAVAATWLRNVGAEVLR